MTETAGSSAQKRVSFVAGSNNSSSSSMKSSPAANSTVSTGAVAATGATPVTSAPAAAAPVVNSNEDQAAVHKRIEHRRRTNVAQTFKADDIHKLHENNSLNASSKDNTNSMSVGLMSEKLKPNKKYNYKCKGDVDKGNLRGKHVEWEASFERPIDEMLYPSLQFFDMDAFEERKKQYIRLHGHYDSQFSKTAVPQAKRDLVLSTKLLNSGVTLIKASNSTSELLTPKWTVKLSDVEYTPSDKIDLISEINEKGEVYLRKQIKNRYTTALELEAEAQNEKNNPISKKKKKDNLEAVKSDRQLAQEESDSLYRGLATPLNQRSREERTAFYATHKISSEIRIFDENKAALEKLLPSGSESILDGVMYYRIKKDIRAERTASVDDGDELSVESTSSKPLSRRTSEYRRQTMFTQRLQSNAVALKEQSIAESDEQSTMRSLDFEILDTDLTRIRRALQTKNLGYDYQEILNVDVTKFPDIKHGNTLSKRLAQDTLLLSQLKSGILPESFIKKSLDPNNVAIDLSNYGIGDDHGKCLAEALTRLPTLRTLGLRDNRLTSESMSFIIKLLPCEHLLHLDISRNNIHGSGCSQLSTYLMNENRLEFLDISDCNIDCTDAASIWRALHTTNHTSRIREIILSDNHIRQESIRAFCTYLCNPKCTLTSLNLAWNDTGFEGAAAIAKALTVNSSLTSLDLTANSVQDYGGQRLAAALYTNKTIKNISLVQNNICGGSCFVFSKALTNHPSMQKLDLSTNPLGDAGGRSLFRVILKGLKCFVVMRNCEYRFNDNVFNYTNPSEDSPYQLDFSEPYNGAVMQELISKAAADPINCRLESVLYRETPKSKELTIPLVVNKGEVVLKSTGQKWVVPLTGIATVSFSHTVTIPGMEQAISQSSLDILCIIVANGRTDIDKKNWLRIQCQDIYLTTTQAQWMIDYFIDKRTIGAGGLTKLDVLTSVWARLLDTENMYDFLCRHLDQNGRRKLIYALTFERFKFNWINPTGHWRLNLEDNTQRAVMLQIIAINNSESEYSKTASQRQDTSQHGNWYNFRNACLNSKANEIVVDKDFVANLPLTGTIEFDYVSTKRPRVRRSKAAESPGNIMEMIENENENYNEEEEGLIENETLYDDVGDSRPGTAGALQGLSNLSINVSGNSSNNSNINTLNSSVEHDHEKIITDEQFYRLIEQMGLTNRYRATGSTVIFMLMELQLASTKYYFPTEKIIAMLEYFGQDDKTQSKVVITLFCRVWDLYNFDAVMRQLSSEAQKEVFLRIGCLNIVNPLKPNLDFILSLKYMDNRILVHSLLEISASDCGDQINEDPRTELSVVTLYGSTQRLLNEARPEVMRFSFCEVGERSLNVSWTMRRDQIRRYLVGDANGKDREMYKIISMYKEMEAAGFLARGPVELQYAQFLKTKVSPSKKSKLRSLVNARKFI